MTDIRNAWRALRSSPGFTLTAVGLLALGLGANTAIFSALRTLVLSGLPYPDSSRLVMIWEHHPSLQGMLDNISVARLNFEAWQARTHSFSGMAAWRTLDAQETGNPAGPQPVRMAWVSVNLPAVLGVAPALGRVFRDEEGAPGHERVAILADKYWQKHFARDPSALGRTVTVDGKRFTVIGVMRRDFRLISTMSGDEVSSADLFVPLASRWAAMKPEDAQHLRELNVIARLRPGATLEQARAEMLPISLALEKEQGEFDQSWRTNLVLAGVEDQHPVWRNALWILFGSVGFVLLIACSNLASVMLARAARRKRDVAIRIALGATRSRIARQFLTETLLLALAGGATGLVVAYWSIAGLKALATEMPRHDDIAMDWVVFTFSLGVAIVAGVLFGLIPAIAAVRRDVNADLRAAGGRGSTASHRTTRVLVACQVALALVLASGAGLLLRSLYTIATTDLGYQPERVLMFDLSLNEQRYAKPAQRAEFNRRLIERLAALPGVTVAAVSDTMPLHRVSAGNIKVEGREEARKTEEPIVDYANVSPGFFEALGIRLLAGRLLTDADVAAENAGAKEGVAVVNRACALKLWNTPDAIGKRFRNGDGSEAYTVVGVVGDQYQLGPENEQRAQIFVPSTGYSGVIGVVRSANDPLRLQQAVAKEVLALDPDQSPTGVRTLANMYDTWLSNRRVYTTLLALFAALAVLLAAIGVYGVLAQAVAARTQEIGIRMALGAGARQVLALFVRQSLATVGLGVAAGLAGTLALSRFVESLLFHVRARDPFTLAALTLLVFAVAAVATLLPARRATRIDPTVALREE